MGVGDGGFGGESELGCWRVGWMGGGEGRYAELGDGGF